MTGVIAGRMSPESKTNKVTGLLATSNLRVKPCSDGESDAKLEITPQDAADYIVYFINENTLGQSPLLEIKVGNKFVINAILDSGSEVNLISQDMYDKLTKAGTNIPVLPVENVVLVTAFGRRSNRIRIQAFIEFTVGTDQFENVFMVSSQLRNDAIIGCQFLKEYRICINFDKGAISYVRDGVLREHEFVTRARLQNTSSSECGDVNRVILPNTHSTVQQPQNLSADCDDPDPARAVNSCSNPPHFQTRAEGSRYGVHPYNGSSSGFLSHKGTLDVSKGNNSLDYVAAGEYLGDVVPNTEVFDVFCDQRRGSDDRTAVSNVDLCINYVKGSLPGCEPNTYPKQSPTDPRSLRKEDVSNLVEQVACLTDEQRKELFAILVKYLKFLTTKPGMCTLLRYKFQITSDQPIISYSRPIPFAQRPAIQEQLSQMLADGILEYSTSPILNPLSG
jgi:hypothetical protein